MSVNGGLPGLWLGKSTVNGDFFTIMFSRGYLHKSSGLLLCCPSRCPSGSFYQNGAILGETQLQMPIEKDHDWALHLECRATLFLPELGSGLGSGPGPNHQTHSVSQRVHHQLSRRPIWANSMAWPTGGRPTEATSGFQIWRLETEWRSVIGGHPFPMDVMVTFMDGSWCSWVLPIGNRWKQLR